MQAEYRQEPVMGQAIDLPDTPSDGPQTTGNVDDLLAQMAGDEIDRLLAEDEKQEPTTLAAPADHPIENQIAAAEPQDLKQQVPAAETTAIEETPPDISQQLDALFGELTREPAPGAAVETPAQAAAVAETPEPIAATVAPDAGAAAPAGDAVESNAANPAGSADLAAEVPAVPTGKSPVAAHAEEATSQERAALIEEPVLPEADDAQSGVPLHLKLLLWINAPLAWCGDSGREWMGKAAILTLINALVLLAYVLFFRG
jgi:hypothetical protein